MSFQIQRHTSDFERAPRASRACQLCHDRKVRCDASSQKPRCTNCQRDGQRCKPRMRQPRSRKKGIDPQASEPGSSYSSLNRMPSEPPVLTHDTNLVGENSDATSANEATFMDRSLYIAPDKLRGEDGSEPLYDVQTSSDIHKRVLDLQRALELPPRALRDGLLENFWSYCYPWDPIIDKSQVMSTPAEKLSPLLLQAIFLAGSRMSSTSVCWITPNEFYNRAKALFYLNSERDPLTLLSAASLLHWWNPHGPERISTDTSIFWSRTAIGLAQQIGLHKQKLNAHDGPRRRKLWWSLVARDCLISLAHGRPQAINPDDCDVPRLTVNDFPDSNLTGLVFIGYVELSQILGRFTANELRKMPSRPHQTEIVDSLYRWVKTLPVSISPWRRAHGSTSNEPPRSYDFECRQLYTLYLVSLVLLYRPRTVDGPFPTAAVIASSLVASVFEEFLVRDEVRLLGPVFTFHLLVAAITLLSCYRYPHIWTIAHGDLKVIQHAQQELLKKWPSALGSIRTFERMQKLAITTLSTVDDPPQVEMTEEQASLFQDIDVSVCRMRNLFQEANVSGSQGVSSPHERDMPQYSVIPKVSFSHQPATELSQDILRQGHLDEDMYNENIQVHGSIGDWLFWDQLQSDLE